MNQRAWLENLVHRPGNGLPDFCDFHRFKPCPRSKKKMPASFLALALALSTYPEISKAVICSS